MILDRNRLQEALNERTREVLSLSQRNRLMAISSFSVRTVQACIDLRTMLNLLRDWEMSPAVRKSGEECLINLETLIREEFLKTFGHDMIQPV